MAEDGGEETLVALGAPDSAAEGILARGAEGAFVVFIALLPALFSPVIEAFVPDFAAIATPRTAAVPAAAKRGAGMGM